MEHSKKYESVKKYYGLRIWSKATIKKSVTKGWITAAEYEEITGDVYE